METKTQENDGRFFFGFVPQRLDIQNSPDLFNFPSNVLFVDYRIDNRQLIQVTAIYEPDLSTFEDKEEKQTLNYKNRYDSSCWLEISYSKKSGLYEGKKYVNKELVISTNGSQWQEFFHHFTAPGLSGREMCLTEPLFNQEETPIYGFKPEP